VLDAFVWQGEPDAFLRSLYALDPSGTRMASQYWGVPRRAAPGANAAPPDTTVRPAQAPPAPDSAPVPAAGPQPARRTALGVWWAGLGTVIPWWLALLAAGGLVLAERAALVWALPLAVCAVLPSALTYVEPRSLLPLAPLAAIYAAVAVLWITTGVPPRWRQKVPWLLPALAAVALAMPTLRDLVRAWPQTTPLQQVATARRAVGEYLGRHLPADSAVMSWHPAIAIWADRPWRVLPYDSFARIVRYAGDEEVSAIVFSRFEPSPIRQPPRPFTVVLPGAEGATPGAGGGASVQLRPLDETPLLFVGRLAAPASRP